MLLLHVSVERGLGGEDLVTVLTGEAFGNVVVVPFDVSEEIVLLQEQLVADEALERLPVVGGGEVELQLCRRPEQDIAFPASLVQLTMNVWPVFEIVSTHLVVTTLLHLLLLLMLLLLLLLLLLLMMLL